MPNQARGKPLTDYRGPFDPEVSLASFSRQTLSDLGREFLLSGHLQDRVALPLVLFRFGEEGMNEVSIEEWMAASPIYSERVQRALGFVGNDVGTVFKNIQMDIGSPHQFMDFQFRLDRPSYGEFWLAHCGALMDVEPFGEERVRAMCHDIEDPTFDATAAATNPLMKVRPIHRPPRLPAHRMPHCRWKVFLDDEGTAYEQHPLLDLNRLSKAANLVIPRSDHDAEPGGWHDYSGAFDPGFQFEDLSHRALVTVLQEIGLQIHLLARAFSLSVTGRWGDTAASELAADQWTGIGALSAERLMKCLSIEGSDIEAVAKVFQMHPCFQPRAYVDLRIEIRNAHEATISIGDCPALDEVDAHNWFAGLSSQGHPALDAIAGAVNPQASLRPAAGPPGSRFAWNLVIDSRAPARPPPKPLELAKVSQGASFIFERRRLPRGLKP